MASVNSRVHQFILLRKVIFHQVVSPSTQAPLANQGKQLLSSVKKGTILAAGVIGTPQKWMLSGIGPTDMLEAVNVSVKVELPGVGQLFQESSVSWSCWSLQD
jgi:choline dehydrogenase-like flavoprotein